MNGTRLKLLLSALLVLSAVFVRAAEIQVLVSGKYFGEVDAYRIGPAYYLSARDAAAIFGGQMRWFAVAQRVQWSQSGRQAVFLIGSAEATLGSDKVRLSTPVILRSSRAFVPLDFFLSSPFAAFSGSDARFNPSTGLLTVDKRITVGPLRWVSYPDYTRVVLPLGKSVSYSVARRGRDGLSVSVPFGRIDGAEDVSVHDGVVKALQLRQTNQYSRLLIRWDGAGRVWQKTEASAPRRLVIDVYRDAQAMKTKPAPGLEAGEGQVLPPEIGVSSGAKAEAIAASSSSVIGSSATGADYAPAAPATLRPEKRKYRVVVDAGHGGKDSGARGRHGALEKDITLSASKELAVLLKEDGSFDVLLTRNDDTFIPLDERSRRANEFKADMFVSLHANAASRRVENGFEIYSLSEKASDPESQRVAEAENAVLQLEDKSPSDADAAKAAGLLRSLAREEYLNDGHLLAGFIDHAVSSRSVGLGDRGIKEAAFYVLRGTDAPAVLVEMGFVTNSSDEAKLESKRYRRRLIDGICAGIVAYSRSHAWSPAK